MFMSDSRKIHDYEMVRIPVSLLIERQERGSSSIRPSFLSVLVYLTFHYSCSLFIRVKFLRILYLITLFFFRSSFYSYTVSYLVFYRTSRTV